ncbi:hybrid sensor histidine kinase/response regulator transcription factor [Pontibacter russatus]|uniref:hybrid sensor histidine kinase/response regulator transcription factor n=1 Tax=Pontibacter russatus TaxID=2694929 RepID=UPI00137B8800|nr:hybrid sensor histidine kinase/response regulator transcription factor [Pontibacter russatus]
MAGLAQLVRITKSRLSQKRSDFPPALYIVRWGILLGAFLLNTSFIPAQPENIIKQYGVADGLSLGMVTSITQDDKGLMWFATEDGLNRFDGYSFKVFKYVPNQAFSLTGNFIQKVFKDSKGVIWASSRYGLNRFDAKTESFVHYQHDPNDKSAIVGNDITDITESGNGDLWVASYNSGFSYYNRAKNSFIPYSKQTLHELSSDKVISLYEDSKGLLWVGTQDGGVNVFRVRKGVVLGKDRKLSQRVSLSSSNIRSIYEDHLHNIWIGTSHGLVLYQRENGEVFRFDAKAYPISGNTILSIREDSKEMLWIGVQGGGAYKLDLRQLGGHSIKNIVFTEVKGKDGGPITQRSVQAIYEDKDQNMWIGTHGDGIAMVSNLKERFIHFQHGKTAGGVEGDISYYGICADNEGNLWLGTDADGIYKDKLNKDTDKPTIALEGKAILCALQDKSQNLWFGSYAQGLFLYNKETDSFVNFRHAPADNTSLGGNDVRVVFEDSKHNIWIGTNGGGLNLFDKETQTFKNFNPSNSSLTSNDVRAIAEDKKGTLWIGTYGGGLYRFSPTRQSFTKFDYKPEGKGYLSSDVVLALHLDAQENLWIGTEEDGLMMYNSSKNELVRYSEQTGLANNTVYAILSDLLGSIWMSTNKGLSKLDVKTKKFYNYDGSDGLQSGQFNSGSALYNKREGYMAFGGTQGLTIFYPAQVKERLSAPNVMITGLQLFNKPAKLNKNTESSQSQAIGEGGNVVLQPNQSVFTVEFGALDYSSPEKNSYAYKLEGLDREWNYVGSQRSATYRYLEPGDYTFMVKASNSASAWGNDFTSVQISVLPPLWRTPLAYLFYLLVLAGAVYWGYSIRNRQKKLRRRLLLAKAQSRKERKLAKDRLSFFTEVSHEFRTPLTLMLGPLEEMIGKESLPTPSGRKLRLVYQNAQKLLHLINQLLDYRKADAGNMVLKVRREDIAGFIEEVYTTFRELAERKRIDFSLHAPDAPVLVWYDREKLEMVLNNLLSNSFKYIGTGNAIAVTISTERGTTPENQPGFVVVEVKDNGIGIPAGKLKHIFEWFYQGNPVAPMSSGLGLALAKKLIELHKGQIFAESTEGEGSRFGFKLLLGKGHFEPGTISEGEAPPALPERRPEAVLAASESKAGRNSGHRKGFRKILIVEDEEEIRAFLKGCLEDTYHLIEAANGKEGLEQALAHHPDIVISDVRMPVLDGIVMCRELKSNIRTSHIPVVLLTARTALTHHKEGLETGADAYLTKPFSPELLRIKLHNLLQSQEKLKRFYLNLFHSSQPQPEKEADSIDGKFLQNIYEILRANLDNPDFNVNELSAALHLSRSLVYKKIKALTGSSPVEYLRSLKMQEAARLLKSGRHKVFEVAYMVGFNDEKYFRQCFSKEFGCSPSTYINGTEIAV